MVLRRFVSMAMIGVCLSTWAIPGILNAKEDWIHSMPRQCLLKKQSHFDQAIALNAERGNSNAQYQLGVALYLGAGLPQDTRLAHRWMLRAANQNHLKAMGLLASMYLHGKGVKISIQDAAHWYQKAATGGDTDAQYALALMHMRGEGVHKDVKKASAMLVTLANEGHAGAQGQLGTLLLTESLDNKLKAREAVTWLKRAKANGNEDAEYYLILAHVQLTPQESLPEAQLLWLTNGANASDVRKMYLLGMMYRYGAGVHQNLDMAKSYLSKAANAGDESARVLMGTFE